MKNIKAVVIGASTGGPQAVYKVITELPYDIGIPIFVVQHMPEGFTKAFSERLNSKSHVKVVEACDNEAVENNTVYVARGGYHMTIGRDKRIHYNLEKPLWGVRPSADYLFKSAADVYCPNLISIVLTGMGKDGSHGTQYIKDKGGITVSQDKATSTIYGMPKSAFETGKVDFVLPLNKIKDKILEYVKEVK